MCNTCRHSLGTIQSYMAWNFLPSYLVYILYCVWKVKASKAQAGFRLMLFYKSEINFRLQFKFRIKRREGTQLYIILQFPHFCTTDGILENHINLTRFHIGMNYFFMIVYRALSYYGYIMDKHMIWITRNKSDSRTLFNTWIETVQFSIHDFHRSLHLFYSPWNHTVAQFAPLRLCNLIS